MVKEVLLLCNIKSLNMHTTNINARCPLVPMHLYCNCNDETELVTLQWRRPLFAFPHTVTLQGTIESRKVSHYQSDIV